MNVPRCVCMCVLKRALFPVLPLLWQLVRPGQVEALPLPALFQWDVASSPEDRAHTPDSPLSWAWVAPLSVQLTLVALQQWVFLGEAIWADMSLDTWVYAAEAAWWNLGYGRSALLLTPPGCSSMLQPQGLCICCFHYLDQVSHSPIPSLQCQFYIDYVMLC